jgi:hypothetical protein
MAARACRSQAGSAAFFRERPAGLRFAPRARFASDRCDASAPTGFWIKHYGEPDSYQRPTFERWHQAFQTLKCRARNPPGGSAFAG